MAVFTVTSAPAWAIDYPSWDDVLAAKGNEQAKAAEVTRIQGLIVASQQEAAAAQALAEKRGAEYQVAQDAFDAADTRATNLQAQADASKAAAEAATARAGLLAAQLYRSGGTDMSANLFLDSTNGQADQFLSNLGRASQLAEINGGVYESAVTAQNTAQSQSDQAEVARGEREKLRVAAEAKMAEAVAASQAAEAKLAEQEDLQVTLNAQLAALQDVTAQTTQQYEAGVAERKRQAEAAAAAARAAAAAAAARAAAASGRGGEVSSSGWTVPAYGRITDVFGPRPGQPAGANLYHRGTDIGAGCGSNIYAANSGTVVYAGPNGTYGNWVQINHGGGVNTGYAHIRDGGIRVDVGDYVDAGDVIAYVGSTGASTGCHLHFEVRLNGSAVNAQPFMSDRGAALG